jgi:hypothetical protein
MSGIDPPITIGVLPYGGPADDRYWYGLLVNRIRMDPGFREVRTDYVVANEPEGRPRPDLLLSIAPRAKYRSSWKNFFINWPGFIVFTPAWNGYVYYADLDTELVLMDSMGRTLRTQNLPMHYEMRHAELDRTAWAELSWFEVSLMAFIGGIYNANSFDRDVVPQFQTYVQDNYASYVYASLAPEIATAARRVAPASETGPEAAR